MEASAGSATRVPRSPPSPEPGFPALYLEARIGSASRLAERLEVESDGRDRSSSDFLRDITELRDELRRAARELEFLGAEAEFGFDRGRSSSRARPVWDESVEDSAVGTAVLSEAGSGSAGSIQADGPVYRQYTAPKYDRTVDQLRSRRRRILGWTIGLAVGISATLELLNLVAREPMPSWWLALLPLVWLVPVPFFVLSFWGTQRTLRANPLGTGVTP